MDSVDLRERINSNIPVGLWTPMNNSFVLQLLKDAEQKKAIDVLLKKGYEEYYYVMNNFEDPKSVEITDKLLDNARSEEHTSELQSRLHLVCRLLLEKKKKK